MLSQLRMKLETDGELNVYQSSNLQGVLMEKIDTSYAEKLHESGLNPYSQHLENDQGLTWVINTFTKEASEQIIAPFLCDGFNGFELTGRDLKVKITEKQFVQKPVKELMDRFYAEKSDRLINVWFITPTSFKSNGEYLIYPDLELIYRSLMKKYSLSEELDMFDSETLDELAANSRIIGYNLRSCFFPLEKVKIHAFRGDITIKVGGTQTLANYANMLMRFGEYSGVGIKCSIGMGAIKIKEKQRRKAEND